MRSGLMWVVLLLAAAAAWFLFFQGERPQGDGGDLPLDDGGRVEPEGGPELMGSGEKGGPRVPRTLRGRGTLQGIAKRGGVGAAADVELRHVQAVDTENPFAGGFARLFFERMLHSGLSDKPAIARTTTAADGRFRFQGLAPGLYEVRATAADGALGVASATLPAAGARVEVNVDIPDGDQALRGRVAYANGKPFQGMVVITPGMEAFAALMGGSSAGARPGAVDEEGRFAVTGLSPGRYQVSAMIPGVLRVMGGAVQVPYDGEYVLTINAAGVEVKGKVVAAAGGAPIAGASVFGGGGDGDTSFTITSTTSATDGTFTMTIPAGRGGGMFVRAAGYAPQMVQFRGGIDESVVVEMQALGSLSGLVTAAAGGAPVAGARVFASTQGQDLGFGGVSMLAAVTDAAGRYAIDGVAPGAVKVHALGGGWASIGLSGMGIGDTKTPYVVEVAPGGAAEQNLEVVPCGKVAGRVLDDGGRPVSGAVVQAGASGEGDDVTAMLTALMTMGVTLASDVSDVDGAFEIDALVPGSTYRLAARAPEYPDVSSEPFQAVSGKTETVDVAFPAARWIEVRVLQADGGAPLPGARVAAVPGRRDDSGRIVETFFGAGTHFTTDADGTVRVGPLKAGPYTVQAAAGGYIDGSAPLDDGAKGPVTVELQKGLVIAGRLRLPEGVPVQSVRVRVQRDPSMRNRDVDFYYGRAAVSPDGTWRVDDIKSPGAYRLTATGTWNGRRFEAVATVDAGTEDFVLELQERESDPTEEVTIRVVDAEGQPVPSGRVRLQSFSEKGSHSSGTRLSNGKAVIRGFRADGEIWVEVYDLLGGTRGAAIEGPLDVSSGEVEVRLPVGRTIAGVVKGPDGQGVAGVRVQAEAVHPAGENRDGNDHGEAVSDGDGRFTVRGLGDLGYELRFETPAEYAPVERRKVLAGDQNVTVTLRAGLRAVLTLLDPAGKPVVGARAWANRKREGGRSGWISDRGQRVSDGRGVLTLEGLDPDAVFELHVNKPNDRDDLKNIHVSPWVPADATLTFERAWVIRGTVVTTDGKPATRVQLRYRKAGAKDWKWASVQDGGRFELEELDAGSYELSAKPQGAHDVAMPSAPGAPPPPEPPVVTVRAGTRDAKVVVDLGGTLRVRVRDLRRATGRGPRSVGGMSAALNDGKGRIIQGGWVDEATVEFVGLEPRTAYRLQITNIAGGRYVLLEGVRSQEAVLDVESKQGVSITGRLKLPAGAKVRGASVSAQRDGIMGANTNADLKSLTFTLDGLPEGAGAWTVNAFAWAEEGMYRASVEVAAGGDVVLELVKS